MLRIAISPRTTNNVKCEHWHDSVKCLKGFVSCGVWEWRMGNGIGISGEPVQGMRGALPGLPAAAQPDETDPEGSCLALFILHNMQHFVATWPLAGLLLW